MESAPPLNLTTTVKVEELKAMAPEDEPRDFTVDGELVEESSEEKKNDQLDSHFDNEEERLELDENAKESMLLNSESEVLSPKNPVYGTDKSYQCKECHQGFSRASQLRAHERTHFEEQIYECDQCEQVFNRIALLMSHRREHHRQSFFCNECDAKFSHYNSFRLHLRRHKGDKPFKCTDCNMAFVQVCHLHIHRRVHTGEKPFHCDICNQRFKQVSHLTTHMRVHTNDKPYSCDICSASFSQTSSLTRHKRRHTGEKPFKCQTCGALFVERRNLSRHNLTHTGEKPFRCDKCDARFTQMIDLKRHKMSHSGLKPFKCDVCEAAFSRKNNLRWHKLTHEGDTPHKCEKCNAGFSLMRDMKTHMRTHSGIKPYSCEQCGASFSQPSTLKRHRLSHSGERQFRCTQCKSAFREKSALKRHMLRHEEVKPFACEKCDSTFIEFRNLKRHKVTVHGEERFEGPDVDLDQRDLVSIQNSQPPKKRIDNKDNEDDPLDVYEQNFPSASVAPQQEVSSQSQANHSEPLPLVNSLPQPQHTISEVATTLPSHQQLPEILTIPSQAPGQMPTLLLTQPGQPTKSARPANSCQNHQSHVLTFVEGNYNQWQSWCFCDTPNIPDSSQAVIDTSGAVVNQPSIATIPVVSAAPPPQQQHQQQTQEQQQQQQITYAELQQPQPHQTTVGVQEVNQSNYQVSQYSSSYSDPIHHYEDTSQSDPLATTSHHPQQLSQQNTTKMNPLEEQRLYSMPSMQQHAEQEHHQLQQAAAQQPEHHEQQQYEVHHQHIQQIESQQQQQQQQHQPQPQQQPQQQQQQPQQQPQQQQQQPQQQQQQPQHQHQPQHQQQQQPLTASPQPPPPQPPPPPHPAQHQLPTHPEIEASRQEISQPVDPQVTFQYSLTVSNPATGDIQIQSEAFPANSTDQPVDQPIKKRRPLKTVSKDSQENRIYTCHTCPKSFSRVNHLLIHQRTHTGEKPFQCGLCLQSFAHKNSLTIHMRGHTGERPYSCPTCQTSFTQKSNLRVHMRTHTGEKPFKCTMCEATFTQGSHLSAHIRIHKNERPFACENCQQTFTQRSALKRHTMTHTGDKPHKCEQCTARFSQKDDLRRHQRIHFDNAIKRQRSQEADGNKPKRQKVQEGDIKKEQKCSEKDCSSSFTDKQALSRHIRTVHDIKEEAPKDEGKKKKKKQIPNDNSKIPIKGKIKEPEIAVIEPTRTSRRIREAAEKKKIKQENSDFIMGDFVDMVDEELKPLRYKPVRKERLQDSKGVTKDKMESWCFCEVPHGPDEPHTHVSMDQKVQVEQASSMPETTLQQVTPRQEVGNVIASADASGATSLLQLSMEHVHHNSSTPTVITEGFQPQPVNSTVTLDASSIVATPQVVNNAVSIATTSEQHNQGITTIGQPVPAVSINAANQLVSAVHHPGLTAQTGGRIVGPPVLATGQVVSAGQLVNASQIVTPDGAIYIEAGEMLSNGAVVINPGQGTFISYEQITISSDGQVIGVPVAGSGTETLMLQPAVASVDTPTPTGTVTYTTAPQVAEPAPSQPVQYTTLGGDVLSLFSQVEPGKESVPAEKCVVSKPLECSVCAKSFAQKRTLWNHMNSSHPELFSCSECCAAFTTAEFLNHHKAQHQKLHVCSRCGMAFTSKTTLNRHRQQVHVVNSAPADEKEKVFSCEICRTKFYQHSDLRRHMLGHTGEKPFRCKHCDAGFTRTSSLNKHMRIHTGEKPYACSVCDQSFAYRYQFNRHRLTHKQVENPQSNNYTMPHVFVE